MAFQNFETTQEARNHLRKKGFTPSGEAWIQFAEEEGAVVQITARLSWAEHGGFAGIFYETAEADPAEAKAWAGQVRQEGIDLLSGAVRDREQTAERVIEAARVLAVLQGEDPGGFVEDMVSAMEQKALRLEKDRDHHKQEAAAARVLIDDPAMRLCRAGFRAKAQDHEEDLYTCWNRAQTTWAMIETLRQVLAMRV